MKVDGAWCDTVVVVVDSAKLVYPVDVVVCWAFGAQVCFIWRAERSWKKRYGKERASEQLYSVR